MKEQVKKVEEMTVEELKSLGYDMVKELQRIQQNIQVIEQELQKRSEK